METLTPLIKFYVEFCVKRIFQVEELRVMNKDQEGQPLKLGDVTPRLTLHISNKYKNSSLGMPSHLTPTILIPSKKPSYMAIKKALYGRQPGCFYF